MPVPTGPMVFLVLLAVYFHRRLFGREVPKIATGAPTFNRFATTLDCSNNRRRPGSTASSSVLPGPERLAFCRVLMQRPSFQDAWCGRPHPLGVSWPRISPAHPLVLPQESGPPCLTTTGRPSLSWLTVGLTNTASTLQRSLAHTAHTHGALRSPLAPCHAPGRAPCHASRHAHEYGTIAMP